MEASWIVQKEKVGSKVIDAVKIEKPAYDNLVILAQVTGYSAAEYAAVLLEMAIGKAVEDPAFKRLCVDARPAKRGRKSVPVAGSKTAGA